jgi:holin-like protein
MADAATRQTREGGVLTGLAAIVLFEIGGDMCQQLLGLPIPGPVIGMALLLLALILRGGLSDGLERAATGLLSYLPILFVPAGVGVMAHFDLIRAEWPALLAGIVGSSVLAVVATALTMRAVERIRSSVRAKSSGGAQPVGGDP